VTVAGCEIVAAVGRLEAARREVLQRVVESGVAIAAGFEAQAKAGVLSDGEARGQGDGGAQGDPVSRAGIFVDQ
jgi:hypothetical protein